MKEEEEDRTRKSIKQKKNIHSKKVEKGDGYRRKNQVYAFMYN